MNLDELLNNLNELVEGLDDPDEPPKKSNKPPPPAPPPKTSSSLQFVPPPPKDDSFLPPPPPAEVDFPPPQITVEAQSDFLPPPPDTFLPPPPPAGSHLQQDQEDLSAMIDDLETFSNTLSVNPSGNWSSSNISGSNSGSINMADDQFGTIRRTGASFVPPDFDDDLTLESLAIDLTKDEGLTSEAELAKMNPVISELDSLAASLSNEAIKTPSLVTSSTTVSSTTSSRPPSTVSSGSSGLTRSIIKMPPPLPPKPGSLKYQRNTSVTSSSVTSINECRYSASRDSIHSCSTTNSSTEGGHNRVAAETKTVKFAMPAQEVLSVDSGVDTLTGSADIKTREETPEEREKRLKEDRVKIAMEKLKEARIQKLVVKVFNKDQSSKTMMIDERMTTRNIVNQLLEKNHFDFQPDWTLMEEIPSLYMERMFEEHEKPCDFLSFWTRDSTNQLRLLERKDKYALFKTPQRYLLNASDAQAKMQERQKQSLIEEFFSGGGNSLVPEVQGWLFVKGDSKSWSKKYCVLRSSGLYVNKGGEPKKGKKLSDLSSLVLFESNQLYHGRGWRKKYKSPFDYGFALKHPSIQVKSKQIKYFCCEDFPTYMSWTIGIRLAKNGNRLLENYNKTQEDVKSTSVVTSHLALRQAESEARRNSMTHEGSVRSTASGKVGVRGIFEGAWQRAEQQPDNDSRTRTPSRREKSVHAMQQQQASTNQASGSQESWWSLKPQYEGVPNMEASQGGNSVSSIPPPPSFNNNNNLNKNTNKNNNRWSSSSNPPPEFQPPPPQNKKIAKKSVEREIGSSKESPLTNYYSSQQKTSYKVADFPPPPAFLSDLMASFNEASKKTHVKEDDLIKDLPPPPNVVLNCIQNTRERKVIKKPPPPLPPSRSSNTKLSFKSR